MLSLWRYWLYAYSSIRVIVIERIVRSRVESFQAIFDGTRVPKMCKRLPPISLHMSEIVKGNPASKSEKVNLYLSQWRSQDFKKGGGGVNKKPYINKVHIIILYHYYCVQSSPSFTLNLQGKAVFLFIVISAKIRLIVEGNVFFAFPLPTGYANDRNVYYKKMIHIILIYYPFHAFCSYQAKSRNRIKRLSVILHVGNR